MPSHLHKVFHKTFELVIKFASFFGNLQRIAGLALLFPDGGNGAQRGDEGTGRYDYDFAVPSIEKKFGIILQCSTQGWFYGHIQEHKIWGFSAGCGLIIFFPEQFDMVAHRIGVGLEITDSFLITGGGYHLVVCDERYLGINDDVLLIGQHHDYIGFDAVAFGIFSDKLGTVFFPFLES